jgi:hypothetical protein
MVVFGGRGTFAVGCGLVVRLDCLLGFAVGVAKFLTVEFFKDLAHIGRGLRFDSLFKLLIVRLGPSWFDHLGCPYLAFFPITLTLTFSSILFLFPGGTRVVFLALPSFNFLLHKIEFRFGCSISGCVVHYALLWLFLL